MGRSRKDASTRLRPRGQATHHAGHLRAVGGLLRRLLSQGTEGQDTHPSRARERIRAVRRAGNADLGVGGFQAGRQDR